MSTNFGCDLRPYRLETCVFTLHKITIINHIVKDTLVWNLCINNAVDRYPQCLSCLIFIRRVCFNAFLHLIPKEYYKLTAQDRLMKQTTGGHIIADDNYYLSCMLKFQADTALLLHYDVGYFTLYAIMVVIKPNESMSECYDRPKKTSALLCESKYHNH